MNYFAAFESTPGIRKIVIADAAGSALDAMGGITSEAENVAGLAAVVSRHLDKLGKTSKLGRCDCIVVRSQSSARVLLLRDTSLAALELAPKQLSADVEAKLRGTDWTARAGHNSTPGSVHLRQQQPGKGGVAQVRAADGRAPVNEMRTSASSESVRIAAKSTGPEPVRGPETMRSARLSTPALPPPFPPAPSSTGFRSRTKSAGSLPMAATDAMFSGDLQMVCLPDLLEFCRIGQRTGTLLCSSKDGSGRVKIRRGMIVDGASAKTNAATLLSRLVDSGDATEEQVKGLALKGEEESDNVLVAQRLIAGGFTDPEAVRKAMLSHVQDIVEELLCWTAGKFAFHPAVLESEPAEPVVEFNPQVILLRIYKEQDEAAR